MFGANSIKSHITGLKINGLEKPKDISLGCCPRRICAHGFSDLHTLRFPGAGQFLGVCPNPPVKPWEFWLWFAQMGAPAWKRSLGAAACSALEFDAVFNPC